MVECSNGGDCDTISKEWLPSRGEQYYLLRNNYTGDRIIKALLLPFPEQNRCEERSMDGLLLRFLNAHLLLLVVVCSMIIAVRLFVLRIAHHNNKVCTA